MTDLDAVAARIAQLTTEQRSVLYERLREQGVDLDLLPIPPTPRDRTWYPLSPAQEYLWFFEQLHPGTATYNILGATRLTGPLDVERLRQAVEATLERHEITRAVFAWVDGGPKQSIVSLDASGQPAFRVVDARHSKSGETEGIDHILHAESSRPFDLRTGPLIRVTLVLEDDANAVLLVVMHHIVGDGWSMRIFEEDVSAVYASGSTGAKPPLAIQYLDYAEWHRAQLAGSRLEETADYWRAALADPPPPVTLPSMRDRSGRGGAGAYAEEEAFLSPASLAAAEATAAAEGVTLFTVLLAAFTLVLSRYGDDRGCAVGVSSANRGRSDLEAMVGYFTNVVVVPVRPDPATPFRTFLHEVQAAVVAAQEHQDLPLGKLVELVGPTRDLQLHPIYDVGFNFMNLPGKGPAFPGVEATPLTVTARRLAQTVLTVSCWTVDSRLRVVCDYSAELLPPDGIRRLLSHFEAALAAAATEPDVAVGDVDFVGEEERAVSAPRAPRAIFPVEPSIHRRFWTQAQTTPDAVAVSTGGLDTTYGALWARAGAIAEVVADRVAMGSRVVVCARRSSDMIAAALGVLRAGAAYVPVEPDTPPARVAHVVADAGVELALIDAEHRDTLPEGLAIISLDQVPASPRGEAPDVDVPPTSPAYVIYTSGSTGRPKGAVVTHGNVVRLFAAALEHVPFDAGDTWSMFHASSFDFSVWEMWGALLHGGRVVVVPADVARSPSDFLALLRDQRVSMLSQTPTAFGMLTKEMQRAGWPALSLRAVVFGGEALDVRVLRPWLEELAGDGCVFVNMYGITETTVHVTSRPLTRTDLDNGISPIGRPLADVTTYVLDRRGRVAPVGVPGEVYVGGAGVCLGYFGQPALTASRFLPDPFSGTPGARMYRSGDVVRTRPDGELEYVGRRDAQVKIRGFRIELGEIDAVLAGFPGVSAAATAVHGSEQQRTIVACVVPAAGPDVDIKELLSHARVHLPRYMVPSTIVVVDALPVTLNGKVAREAVADLAATAAADTGTASGGDGTSDGPSTPTEQKVADMFCDLLHLDTVPVDESFFDLGGHSLLLTELVFSIFDTFEVELPLLDIYENVTVRQAASAIDRLVEAEAAGP
jgi:amino acid adenylation domain-containing protein